MTARVSSSRKNGFPSRFVDDRLFQMLRQCLGAWRSSGRRSPRRAVPGSVGRFAWHRISPARVDGSQDGRWSGAGSRHQPDSPPVTPDNPPTSGRSNADPRFRKSADAADSLEAHLLEGLEGAGSDRFWRQRRDRFRPVLHAQQLEQIGRRFLRVHADFLQGKAHLLADRFRALGLADTTVMAQNINQGMIGNGAAIGETTSFEIGDPLVLQAAAEIRTGVGICHRPLPPQSRRPALAPIRPGQITLRGWQVHAPCPQMGLRSVHRGWRWASAWAVCR